MTSQPPIADSIGQVFQATKDSAEAVGRLAGSELDLAGAALLRAALLATLASACVASAAIMLMILLVAMLMWVGLAWPAAVAVATILAILLAWVFAIRARQMLKHCRMAGTRRQLAALFALSTQAPS